MSRFGLNWTLRKKILGYYARIALGLVALGVSALVFQKVVEFAGKNITAGNWVEVGRVLVLGVLAIFLVILLLYLVDRWYGNIISRMSGQKGPPKE